MTELNEQDYQLLLFGHLTINRWGTKFYVDDAGELHRDNGPAVVYTDGTEEYWLNGEVVDEPV